TYEDEKQHQGRDVFNDEFINGGNGDVRTFINFSPALIDAEYPREYDGFQQSEYDQTHCTCPIVVFVEDPFLKEKDARQAHQEGEQAESNCPFCLAPVELIFHKTHPWGSHGQGGGDTGKEQQSEPKQTGQSCQRGSPLLKQERHCLKSHSETGIFKYPIQSKIPRRNRDNNGTAQHHFHKFVHKSS